MSQKIRLGKFGEKLAKKYYKMKGYEIIAQNYYCLYGELDLVIKKQEKINVIEVKTRKNDNFGWAEEAIDEQKIDRMIKCYQCLQKEKNLNNFYQIELFIVEIKQKTKIIRLIL